MLREKLKGLWKLVGGFEIMDMNNGYFLVSFNLEEDKYKAINRDHGITGFFVTEDTIDKMLVWINFPNLNMMYYDESVLLTIISTIGKPLKVDLNTVNMIRGCFTKVCVSA
uniref:DUF4283 domain-containing protein n=1 Tax=Cajanus cajan TaxID=3821 RepID=A0A151RAP8_CAJCA|nr:hypothetical protein KK1_039063 [Cajanus cajan]